MTENDTLLGPYTLPDNAAVPLFSIFMVSYLADDGDRRYKPVIRGVFSRESVLELLDRVRKDVENV